MDDERPGAGRCGCGRPLSEHDRHLRFRLPDPVLELSEDERAARTWGNDVLTQVQGVGAFVRCLLPVRLSGGYSITFGLWLAVSPAEIEHVVAVWEGPEYADLSIDGWLANAVPPWGADLLAAPAHAVVRDTDQVPYVVSSEHALLTQVLDATWPHEEILGALPR